MMLGRFGDTDRFGPLLSTLCSMGFPRRDGPDRRTGCSNAQEQRVTSATSNTSSLHLDISKVLPAPKMGPTTQLLSTPQAKKVRGNIQLITNYKSLPYPDLFC